STGAATGHSQPWGSTPTRLWGGGPRLQPFSLVQAPLTPWHSRCIAPGGRAPCHPAVPAGTFMSEPCTSLKERECQPCPAGTFRTQPNTLRECQACYECDRQGELRRATVLTNCSATTNIACGCEPGRFRLCLDKQCSEFSCQKCQSCTGRLIQRPCECCQLSQGTTCQMCHLWLCHPASFPPSPQARRHRTHFATAAASLTSTEKVTNAGHVICKH
uniref:TNFR-Cys domain-containing protein n=1 Tax=Taeniopygia guttata TaxID=59729 RepID=A0A674HUA3_TAEGU